MASYDDHGNSGKRHRMDIMDDYLASIGFRRKPVPKDGSSLFRAFSEQMFKTQAYHLYIRESCVRYMKRNQHIFENFVDDSFDDYLARMNSPKEWADQLEISALSKMYSCDFHIYEQPGHRAKNVTENDCEQEVYLCHSGQKHYDCVYPKSYFESYGICQSILTSIILERVLGMSKTTLNKCVDTFRMLSGPSTSNDKSKEYEDKEPPISPENFFEPSIGILVEGIDLTNQSGLAYKFPIPLDVVRSLDPSIYRNVDYDFWLTIKRKQQYVDFTVSEGMQYFIGDRCLISLSIYSKPLVGHVQEVSPNHGPITVFIEALGGRHTISVKNVKPLETYSNGCRADAWPCKQRRRSHSDWNSRNGGSRRYGCRSKHWSDAAPMHSGEIQFNPKYHLEFVALQQKKMRNGGSGYSGNGVHQQRPNHPNLEDDISDPAKSYPEDCVSPPQSKLQHREKSQWHSNQVNELSPTTMFQNMSINQSFIEENWTECNNSGDYAEGTSDIDTYNQACGRNWNQQNVSPNEEYQTHPYFQQHENKESRKMFEQEIPYNKNNLNNQQNVLNESATKSHSPHSSDSSNSETENTRHNQQNAESYQASGDYNQLSEHLPSAIEETYSSANNVGETSHYPIIQHPYLSPDQLCPINQPYPLPQNNYGPAIPPPPHQYMATSPIPSSTTNIQPRSGYLPYQATMTVLDTEGKEMVVTDDKNPFHYFFNLGLEYYRQIRSNQPMSPGPVFLAPPTPPPYSSPVQPAPVMFPQPVAYLPPSPTARYMPTPVQQHHMHAGACMTVPHFHEMMSNMQPSYPPGRLVMHVPPSQTFQQQQQHSQGLPSFSGTMQPIPNPYMPSYPPQHNIQAGYGPSVINAPVYAAPATSVPTARPHFPGA
uniref:OTU domain-containing protein 4 isoform X2 n=1 Tax=Ciona intestinalis TaxID=7719 RepID=UPI00089DA9FF|nr:OTU domain-containing protein 4 isoform X2 [Ciona intestinalis]|eukprot:XP_026689612.1 OTU domain-containing protein 4 isoform X2 [Ciona intestinalis]